MKPSYILAGLSLFAAAFMLTSQQVAHAVVLSPGANTLPGTTSAARPELSAIDVVNKTSNFSFDGITGSVTSDVVREVGTGTLDFYWDIKVNSSTEGHTISQIRIGDFGLGNITDGDWRMDSLGNRAPDSAFVFTAAAYPPGGINFQFSTNPIGAGQSSFSLFLHTSATSYSERAFFDLTATGQPGISAAFSTYAPAVPEPRTCALMLSGLFMLGLAARRRFR